MAFAFFRRRQKTVIVVMVLLMASFMIGPQVMSRIGKGGGSKDHALGHFRDGTKIMEVDLRIAGEDLSILKSAGITPMALQLIKLNGRATPGAYAFLIKEAEEFGLVSEAEIDNLLTGGLIVGDVYRQVVSDLRSQSIPEKRLRQAIARLIRIHRSLDDAMVTTPPSITELEHLYVDLADKVEIRFARIPAEQFIDVVDISQDALAAQLASRFDTFKGVLPGQVDEDNPYGFGYQAPNRVAVEYMLARGDMLMRVVTPPDSELRRYYDLNRSEFTKQVPSGEFDENDEPIMLTKPQSFGEARNEIIEVRLADAVEEELKDIFRYAMPFVRQHDPDPDHPQTAYEYAVQKMQLPAQGLLETLLSDVDIDGESLSEAIDILAEKADLQGICYPLTDLAGEALAEDLRVSVQAARITLGEALSQIAQQAGQPELTWVQCESLTAPRPILFTVGQLSTFPLTAGQTGMVDQMTLSSDPILRLAAIWQMDQPTSPLILQAFDPSLFDPDRLAAEPLSQRAFQELTVLALPGFGDQPSGRLMWRVAATSASAEPEQRTEEIDEAITADIKTVAAMSLAEQYAKGLKDRAQTSSLGKAAGEDDIELVSVAQFSRKTRIQVGVLERDIVWRNVEGLFLPTPSAREAFLKEVFAMTDRQGAPILSVIVVPSDRSVCVVELLRYTPATKQGFRREKAGLTELWDGMRRLRLTAKWSNYDDIVTRLGFQMEAEE